VLFDALENGHDVWRVGDGPDLEHRISFSM
jgi:hypothetical protein